MTLKQVMGWGKKYFDPGRVNFLWIGLGRVRFGLGLENFPLKVSIFSPSGQKVPRSKAGRPLIYYGSKVSSGQGPSLPQTSGS